MSDDARLFAPATDRNREPLLAVLERVLPAGLILEVASGSGQHAAFMAPRLAARLGKPGLRWQPTDRDDDALASIAAWRRDVSGDVLLPPLRLDASAPAWPLADADAIVCVNMIHISPWEACVGLFRGAAAVLPKGAPLVLYGPFAIGGAHTAVSNATFDRSLRERDPRWGVRDLMDVDATASTYGFVREEKVEMPANNLTVVFRRVHALGN